MRPEFLEGIDEFNRGEYFAAHETWERLWLQAVGQEKMFLQGTIQLSAAFHHWTRGNWRGTLSLLRAGTEKLRAFPAEYEGIRVDRLRCQAAKWIEALAAGIPTQPSSPPKIELAGNELDSESASPSRETTNPDIDSKPNEM